MVMHLPLEKTRWDIERTPTLCDDNQLLNIVDDNNNIMVIPSTAKICQL